MYEILYTPIFSLPMWYRFWFAAISAAMLSMAA
jgi:hypothetical protein